MSIRRISAALLLLAAASLAAPALAETPAGQAAFLAQGCNTCHAVPAAGIEAKLKLPTLKAPALPTSPMPEDAWLRDYLMQKTEHDGKKHAKKWGGSDEDLSTMLAWLRGLSS